MPNWLLMTNRDPTFSFLNFATNGNNIRNIAMSFVKPNHYFKAIVNSTTTEHIAVAVEEGVGPGEVGNGAGGGAGYGRFLPSR